MNEFQDDTPKSHGKLLWATCAVSGAWLCAAAWLSASVDWSDPEKWAPAVEAIVTGFAFIWLVAGFFQQRLELHQNTKALLLQFQELQNQVAETQNLVSATNKTAEAMIEQAKHTERLAEESLARAAPRLMFGGGPIDENGLQLRLTNRGGSATVRSIAVMGGLPRPRRQDSFPTDQTVSLRFDGVQKHRFRSGELILELFDALGITHVQRFDVRLDPSGGDGVICELINTE